MLVIALSLASASAVSAAAPDRTAPTRPTNLRITASSATSVSLAWNPSTDNSKDWWYLVSASGSFRVNPPQTTFTRSPLGPGRTYSISVIAIDRAGNRSPVSNIVTYTTPPDTTPPTAPGLSTTSVRPNWISLAWTNSTDNSSQVWVTLLIDGVPTSIVDWIGARSHTALDLQPSSSHSFQVRVRDAYGNTNLSNMVTATTPPVTDTVAPTAPTDLSVFDGGCPEAWMRWTAATDDVDATVLYEYDVDGALVGRGLGGTSDVLYVDPGTHTFVLHAVDGSGNRSGPSNAYTVQIC
jgi:hypothetical protein